VKEEKFGKSIPNSRLVIRRLSAFSALRAILFSFFLLAKAQRRKEIVVRSVRLPEASPAELLGPLRLGVFAACPAELRGALLFFFLQSLPILLRGLISKTRQ
jgi:hypothetical protein